MWTETFPLSTKNSMKERKKSQFSIVWGILPSNLHSCWRISRSTFSKNYWDDIWALDSKIALYHSLKVCSFKLSQIEYCVLFFLGVGIIGKPCASSWVVFIWGATRPATRWLILRCLWVDLEIQREEMPPTSRWHKPEPQLTSSMLNNVTATRESAQRHAM